MKLFQAKKEGETADAGEQLSARLEHLEAKIEALAELRKADSERFERVSEQLGELRNLILQKEEEIKDIGIKASKASELVRALSPETILSEIRKSTGRMEVIDAKIEANKAIYQKLMEEIRDTRKRLWLFNGIEELVKLNKETGSNLVAIKKVEGNVERQSNIIGNLYVQTQKQVGDFLKFKDSAEIAEQKLKDIMKEVDTLKAGSPMVDKKDLAVIRREIEQKLLEGSGFDISKSMDDLRRNIDDLRREVATYTLQRKSFEAMVMGLLPKAKALPLNNDKKRKI